uniref:Uncharacterized protein n=1 Tax=Arundo donax TaxID=35708 RepID=A0A0A8YU47_ARUDO
MMIACLPACLLLICQKTWE